MAHGSLSLRSAPYARLVKRAIFGPGTPKSVAYDEETLCPEETTLTRPPVFLPGQLDRVTGGTEHSPVAMELASMLATTYTHAATIAYHIRDAVLFDGSIYAGNLRHFIADKAQFGGTGEPRHLKAAGLASTTVGTRYFGHWLRDDCIQYLLAQQAGPPICVRNPVTEHKRKYAAYFGQDLTPTDRAFIDDLTIYQDYAQNSLKRRRYDALTNLVRSKFPRQHRDKLVYLRRGHTGVPRPVHNEPALVQALEKHGFVVLDVASDDLDHILATLTRARLVISIEGSHITHCCYALEEGCGLVTLQPSDRFTAFHRHWTECVGVTLGFVVGVPSAFGYQFESREVLETVDQVLNRIEQR